MKRFFSVLKKPVLALKEKIRRKKSFKKYVLNEKRKAREGKIGVIFFNKQGKIVVKNRNELFNAMDKHHHVLFNFNEKTRVIKVELEVPVSSKFDSLAEIEFKKLLEKVDEIALKFKAKQARIEFNLWGNLIFPKGWKREGSLRTIKSNELDAFSFEGLRIENKHETVIQTNVKNYET
jgi:hypothetical protein